MHHKPTQYGKNVTKLAAALFRERDDISQSLLSGNHFHRSGDKKHKSHAFLKPNHLHSCHQ